MKTVMNTAMLLAAVGALNWGLIAVADFNLVEKVFGTGMLTTVVYGLAGLGGLVQLADMAEQYM